MSTIDTPFSKLTKKETVNVRNGRPHIVVDLTDIGKKILNFKYIPQH